MPDQQAIERGRAFEGLVNRLLGLVPMPGSGNKWHARGDGAGGGIRVESKAEQKRSWALTKRQVALAEEQAHGSGDVAVLAVLDDDEQAYVIMTLSSFARIRTELQPVEISESRADARRRRASVPALLRDTAELDSGDLSP